MTTLVLDGLLSDNRTSRNIHQLVTASLNGTGAAVSSFILRQTEIAYCTGCFNCWVKTPGECIIPDAGRDIAKALINSDLLVLLTPVTFGGYSSVLKKALDRIIPLVCPFFMKIGGEVHHRPRYVKYPRLVGIGVLPHYDEESERIFRSLVGRNAINFHSPGHAATVISLDQNHAEMRRRLDAAFVEGGVKR